MIRIERLSADQIRAAQHDLVVLLIDVVNGGASVNFIAPLSTDIATAFWTKVAEAVAAGERVVLAAYNDQTLVGSVQLVLAMQPNGQHRAEVQKVLVHSQHRQQGIGALLMRSIEDTARDIGRRLLVLDTEQGSVAEHLYEKIGYNRAGVIPQYAIANDGSLISTVIFYRFV